MNLIARLSCPLLVLGCLLSTNAQAASFDCAKARSKTEIAICGDAELSQLDEQLAAAYRSAMKSHPIPSYVQARQRDWLNLNRYCDPKALVACLRRNYTERVAQLQATTSIVYANKPGKFSYEEGDAVVEMWPSGPNQWQLSLWGGFAVHPHESRMQNKAVYVGCEFQGRMASPSAGRATSAEGATLKFSIQGNRFVLAPDAQVCAGFGSMPEAMVKVSR